MAVLLTWQDGLWPYAWKTGTARDICLYLGSFLAFNINTTKSIQFKTIQFTPHQYISNTEVHYLHGQTQGSKRENKGYRL